MSAKGDRIRNSLRNSSCGLFFSILSIVLSFLSNRAFIHVLGAELFGLNNTVISIMETLNLAELGVASAMASFLYAPMAGGDRAAVAELVALQGWVYRKVALFVGVAGVVVVCFIPVIFDGCGVPVGYAIATFAVLLLGSLSTYLLNFREVILDADQRNSDVVLSYRLPAVIRLTLQILAIEYTPYGYELWLVLQLMGYGLTAYIMRRIIGRRYPHFMIVDVAGASPLRHKHPEVFRRVGQVFAHNLAYVVMTRVSPLVIYAYTSLTTVASYGNYMLIYVGLSMLLYNVQEGFQGSVGNLVAEGVREERGKVFGQLLALDCLLAAVCVFGFVNFADAFVGLWIGEEMVLGGAPVVLMAVMLFVEVSRSAVSQFLKAHGYFDDVWAAFTEAFLNVTLSIVMGRLWGLTGVLWGGVVSLVLMVLIWKPYYLMRVKGCGSLWGYWRLWLTCVGVAVVVGVLFRWLFGCLEPAGSLSFGWLIWRMCWLTVSYVVVAGGVLCVLSSSMRGVVGRVLGLVFGGGMK